MEVYQRWFDRTLKGKGSPMAENAPVRISVMGANEWQDEYEWPLSRTSYVECYLHSSGDANSVAEGGWLSPEAPQDEPSDHYTHDPENPVPTLGGNHSVSLFWESVRDLIRPGPFDQSPIEQRQDVLIYTTEPLEVDTEITGSVVLKLYAALSAPDTDFVAKLTDVYPDRRSINITEGIVRARLRQRTWNEPEIITPNAIYEYTVDLQVTSNVFKKGHRIRLHVTSSNSPLWDRNPNTGHAPRHRCRDAGRPPDHIPRPQASLMPHTTRHTVAHGGPLRHGSGRRCERPAESRSRAATATEVESERRFVYPMQVLRLLDRVLTPGVVPINFTS